MAKEKSKNRNNPPIVMDLFCGVGGLSLGAARAGFRVAAAVDSNRKACEAHVVNFSKCVQIEADLSRLSGLSLLTQTNLMQEDVQGIIGGPPCQGFSCIGRRHPNDSRNNLFKHFFRIVSEIRPSFFLAENVLGILDPQFGKLLQHALDLVSDYTVIGPLILKASDFGAATSRERVFFFGYLEDKFKKIRENDFKAFKKIKAIDVATALEGLPKKINPNWQLARDGWRTISHRPHGPFWQKIFDEIPPGVGNSFAIEQLDNNIVSGCIGTKHETNIARRYGALFAGQTDKISRSYRLSKKGFCPTLRAGTGPERGSFQAVRPIHPTEPRVITPREAARLQGFPDWFLFDKTKWHSFSQIGNSVSPILAEHILKVIYRNGK